MENLKKIIIYIFTVFMVSLAVFLSFNRGIAFYSVELDFLTIVRINFIKQFAEAVILFLIIFVFYKYVIKGNRRTTIALLLISFVVKIIWIYNFPITFYFDMNSVMDNANYFIGNKGFNLLYMKIYPFNNSISLIDSVYLRFFNKEDAFFIGRIINVLMMVFTEFYIYKITLKISNAKLANFTVFIMILFFPLTGYLVVVYNDMYALMFITLSIYHFICLLENQNRKDFILTIVFLLITNWFRSIGIIFLIAFSMYYLIINYRKAVKFILVSLIALITLNMLNTFIFENIYSLEMNEGIPISHYIYMGMDNGADERSPGYYNNLFEDYAYINGTNYDADDYNSYVNNRLSTQISYMSLPNYISHYSYKFLFQWSCGTFETNLINNLIDNYQDSPVYFYYQTSLQKFIINNGFVYSLINIVSYLFWYLFIFIISLSLIIDILKNIINFKLLLFQIIILGFIGFYIIMETSPHYLFIILPFMIIIFVNSFENLISKLKK